MRPRAGTGQGSGGAPVRLAAALALLAAVLLLAAPLRAEPSFPALTGRVVDAAHLLDPATLSALDAKLAAQEAQTTDQFVVATVPSLESLSIEDYGNRLFRAWKLGQDKKNNGVLLLVAPAERKVRIEVGYGLEGILTDAVASTIIRSAIIPAFKAGDMAGGVVKGADAILEVLNLDPDEARQRARRLEQGGEDPDWIAVLVFTILVAFWIYILFFHKGGPGGRGTRRRGGMVAVPPGGWDWGSRSGGGSFGGGFSGGGGLLRRGRRLGGLVRWRTASLLP